MCLLATIIQVFVGAPIFASGVKAIRFNGRANMDTLVAFSSSTAYFYSFVALIANVVENRPVDADDQESFKYSGSDSTNANVAAWGEPVFESPAILIAIVSTINTKCDHSTQAITLMNLFFRLLSAVGWNKLQKSARVLRLYLSQIVNLMRRC